MDTTLVLTGACVALTAAVIYYHLKVFSFWTSRGIPGPRPWPIFGTTVYYIFKNKLELDTEWRHKYGHTYGLYEGYLPLLRTTDNQLIKHIYIKNFHSFTDRNSRFIEGQVQQNWLLWSKGARWANQRALVSPMFSSAKMRPMFVSMANCVERFLGYVDEEKRSLSSKSDHLILSKFDTSKLTLDVIASCFFGLKLETYDLARNEFLRQAYKFSTVDLSWFIMWLLTPSFLAKRFEINQFHIPRLNYFTRLSQQVISERRSPNSKRKVDIIQAFLDAKLEVETNERVFTGDDDKEAHYNDRIGSDKLEAQQRQQASEAKLFKTFTDIEITGQMVFLFLAGFETTSATISFALLELAAHPEIQAKLHAELKDKFQCSSDEHLAQFDFKTQANHSDFLDLKLLDAFLSETLRLYSPILDHTRVVTQPEGVVLESVNIKHKFKLPHGTAISTNGFVLQRDADYFERPHEFDLMRFHPDNRDKIKSCSFMPFGVGPRYCAGMRFALMEVKLVLAKIIAKCHVAKGSETQEYPPKFLANAVFLQAQDSTFKLLPRIPSV